MSYLFPATKILSGAGKALVAQAVVFARHTPQGWITSTEVMKSVPYVVDKKRLRATLEAVDETLTEFESISELEHADWLEDLPYRQVAVNHLNRAGIPYSEKAVVSLARVLSYVGSTL